MRNTKLIKSTGKALLLTVIAFIGMSHVAFAATNVSGAITVNTTWSLAQGGVRNFV